MLAHHSMTGSMKTLMVGRAEHDISKTVQKKNIFSYFSVYQESPPL